MKKLAKFLSYLWPVLALSYVVGFSYGLTEYGYYAHQVTAEQARWMMAASLPIMGVGIALLFVIHYYYGKVVMWIDK